jgi:hypothetical protein
LKRQTQRKQASSSATTPPTAIPATTPLERPEESDGGDGVVPSGVDPGVGGEGVVEEGGEGVAEDGGVGVAEEGGEGVAEEGGEGVAEEGGEGVAEEGGEGVEPGAAGTPPGPRGGGGGVSAGGAAAGGEGGGAVALGGGGEVGAGADMGLPGGEEERGIERAGWGAYPECDTVTGRGRAEWSPLQRAGWRRAEPRNGGRYYLLAFRGPTCQYSVLPSSLCESGSTRHRLIVFFFAKVYRLIVITVTHHDFLIVV